MNLTDLPKRVPNFGKLGQTDTMRLVLWWGHRFGGLEYVNSKYVRACYDQLSLAIPEGGFTSFARSLSQRKPPQLIERKKGYKLTHIAVEELDGKYLNSAAAAHVDKLLIDLPAALHVAAEKVFLEETLICLRNLAFRATIVMAWNLAYDHLCNWLLSNTKRLADFNTQTPISFPKKGYRPVAQREDFEDYSEAIVLQILKSSHVITDNLHKVLKEKLDRRNIAAHPSGVKVLQATAEEVIRDLVENVILKLT